jgi:hypothetical protein
LTKRIYEIQVDGLVGEDWMSWFEGLTIRHLESGHTILAGMMDQAMLRGILAKLSDLGLTLVSVCPRGNHREEN